MIIRNAILLVLAAFICNSSIAQQSIEGTLEVQNQEKKYSLFIPSTYDPVTPHAMMLCLHPLNVNRWDGESWRDTLIQFAVDNSLILVSPDGGPDGRIDDPIDTLFTSTLVDSVMQWYAIDQDERYIMGFSWGGRTTYTYGLRRTDDYKGLLAIGAAVDIGVISDVISESKDYPIYVLHGGNDAVNTRYTPIVNALEDNEACLNTRLMPGVGHTIDFPMRNDILTEAFNWLRDANCMTSSTKETTLSQREVTVSPNPSVGTFKIHNFEYNDITEIEVYNVRGERIRCRIDDDQITIGEQYTGLMFLSCKINGVHSIKKIIIQ